MFKGISDCICISEKSLKALRFHMILSFSKHLSCHFSLNDISFEMKFL